MKERRAADRTPLKAPSDPPRDDQPGVRDRVVPEANESLLDTGDIDDSLDGLTDTERYEGYLEAGEAPTGPPVLESLVAAELRYGETIDPNVASDEGLAYVPPIDPVVVADPDEDDGISMAAGFGATAFDDPFDEDHHSELLPDEDEMTDRVREAMRADARTSGLADQLSITTVGSTVIVRGVVDDIDDSDLVVEVISEISGVTSVRDRTVLRE